MPSTFIQNTIVNIAPPHGLPKVGDARESEFETFGVLYKHCKGIHLPRSGGYIRLGTLTEYRRNENEAIRDEHEGTFGVTLNFPKGTSIELDALRRATLDTSPLGTGENRNNIRATVFGGCHRVCCVFSTDNAVVEQRTEKEITLSGTVDIHAEGADAYVLCLSTSNDAESIISDPEYDSVWSIKQHHVFEFTKYMIDQLRVLLSDGKHFCRETVGPFNAPGFSPPPRSEHMVFGVQGEIWEVTYRDRTIDISTTITEEVVQDVYECLDKSASIKPESFSHEKEVRIIFRPLLIDKRDDHRYFFPYYLKPMLVSFEPFLRLTDVCFGAIDPTTQTI